LPDPYELWLNQVCTSQESLKRYRIDISNFEIWAREEHELVVGSIRSLWREAKYSGKEAEKERLVDQLKDIMAEYFLYLKKSGITQFSINRSMAVVMSFFHYLDVPIKSIRIKHPCVLYHNRDITKAEICTILEHSDVRNKAVYEMLYETGMRPWTAVRLRWKHIKEDFLARKIPMKIELPSEILKCGVSSRFVFIGSEGFAALNNYLMKRHLPLSDEDYVFVSEKPYGRKLGTHAISQSFNVIVKQLKLAETRGRKPKALRLYCLKKAFSKFMAIEVDRALVEFWVGHTDTKTHYIPEDVEHHRALYAKGYSHLRLTETQIPIEIAEDLKKKNQQIEKLQDSLNRLKPLADLFEDPATLQKFVDLVKSSSTIRFPEVKTTMVKVDMDPDTANLLKAVAEATGKNENDLLHEATLETVRKLAQKHNIKVPKELEVNDQTLG